MPKPIPHDCRVKIVRDRQAGKTFREISKETGYSVSGVKKIWRHFRSQGQAGLALGYERCGRRSSFDSSMHQLIDSIKDGDQGAPYIRSLLQHQHPNLDIPHERTIQRWWKARGTNRAKIIRRPQRGNWTKEVHHTWQIDGKEQIQLKTGEQVSWINVADEASSSALGTVVFPPVFDDSDSATAGSSKPQCYFPTMGVT